MKKTILSLPAIALLCASFFFLNGCQDNPTLTNASGKVLKVNPIFWAGEGWLGLGEKRVLSESSTFFVTIEGGNNFLEKYENGNFTKLHPISDFSTFKIYNGVDSISCLSYKKDKSAIAVVMSIRGDTIFTGEGWLPQSAMLTGHSLSLYGSFHQHKIALVDSAKVASLKPMCRYAFIKGISERKNTFNGKDFRQLRNCDTGQSVLLPWKFSGYCESCAD